MKKTVLTFVIATVVSASVFAQGTFSFRNLGSGSNGSINAPVTNSSTGLRLSGSGFSIQAYATAAGNPDSSLTAIGSPIAFNTGALAGYMASNPNVAIPGVAAGSNAKIQFRAWDNAGGTIASWDTAVNRGESAIVTIPLADSLAPAQPVAVGITGFSISVVPEPSTIALGALGIGSLLLVRRRK